MRLDSPGHSNNCAVRSPDPSDVECGSRAAGGRRRRRSARTPRPPRPAGRARRRSTPDPRACPQDDRLESLEKIQNSYEGFRDSVKTFMHLMQEDAKVTKRLGVKGIIADFVNVTPEVLEQSASVLGEVLDWVVLEKAQVLTQIESFCKILA